MSFFNGRFHNSAVDLRNRYYRRFPDAPRTRWDLTSIKDRWYARKRQGRVVLSMRRGDPLIAH